MKIHRNERHTCRVQIKKKTFFFVSFLTHVFLFLTKIKYFENHIIFSHLIKGTILGCIGRTWFYD